jgi:signal transduction histidine kinase
VDNNYNYFFVGGETLSFIESEKEEVIGKRLFPLMVDRRWEPIKKILNRVFAGEKLTDIEIPGGEAGHELMFDAFPLRKKNGVIERIVVMTRNISELKKIEENLRIALKKEKELSELKSRFVSMASHEFRTPLSTVLSSAYLLEKYQTADDQPKREKHLQRIISSVNMLTDILNDFLSVGKIEEGKITVKPAAFSIKEMAITIAGEMKLALKSKQKIKCTHQGPVQVTMDPALVKHIMMNLISNASKFSPETGDIEIKTIQHNDTLVIAVKDYGMGISEQDQQHLMERFFRGANATNIQGTGLGLHIVSKYAELMQGTIECKSKLEKGTEFVITFNLKKEAYEKNTTD